MTIPEASARTVVKPCPKESENAWRVREGASVLLLFGATVIVSKQASGSLLRRIPRASPTRIRRRRESFRAGI